MKDKTLSKFTMKLSLNIFLSISLIFVVISSWALIDVRIIKYVVILTCIYLLASLIYKDFRMIKNRDQEISRLETRVKKIRFDKNKKENKLSGFKKRIRELKNDNNLLKDKLGKMRKEMKSKDRIISELREDIQSKLKKARDVHQKMLPKILPEPENISVSSYYRPAEYIGGDYYNIFKIDHGHMDSLLNQYLIYYFDVSGHGIDSTLLSIFLNDAIENYFKLRHHPGEMVSPEKLMEYIESEYQKEGFPDDYLVCLFVGLLDANNYTLKYASAGFQFPIYHLDSENEISQIDIGGLPLSTALSGFETSRGEKELKIKENSTLFFSTDGLLEQSDGQNAYHSRIENILSEKGKLPPYLFKDLLLNDFQSFVGKNKINDDLTFLIIDKHDSENIEWISEENVDFSSSVKNIKEFVEKYSSSKLEARRLIDFIQETAEDNKELLTNETVEVKAADNSDYLILTFETPSANLDWKNLNIENSNVISLHKIDRPDVDQLLSENNLFLSYNNFANKAYLIMLK